MSHKNYITPEGYINLKDQLHELVTITRPELVKTISWAAGNGDRSENGDYIYGKKKLREIDKQIYILTKKIENIEPIDSSIHKGSDKIFFGAIVTIYRNDNEQKIRIVGQDETNLELCYISWTSPLARALLGKKIGDSFALKAPKGDDVIEIIDVEY